MASLCGSCCVYAYTHRLYNVQERGISCESDLTRVQVHIWLSAEPGYVHVQGSTSNKHNANADI